MGQYPLPGENEDDAFDVVLHKLSDAPAHVRRVFHAIATALIDHLDEYTVRGFAEDANATHATVLHGDRHHVLGVDFQAGIFVWVDRDSSRRFSLEEVWCRVDDAANRFLGARLLDGSVLPDLAEADFVAEFMRAMNACEMQQDAMRAAIRAARTSTEPAPLDAARGLLDHPNVTDGLRREVERAISAGRASLGPHRAIARFDVAQVISAVASEAVTPDVRLLMERLAGRYLFSTPITSPAPTSDTRAPHSSVASA